MNTAEEKFIPGSDANASEIFQFPYTVDPGSIDFIQSHGRIMFIIRGLPGTGKNSLCEMLMDRYPTGRVCSADDYFSETFTSTKRDHQSLKESHEFCRKKVAAACQKNAHPIIVKNTHVRKYELQMYLDYAADYNYTIILAETLSKFQITPEILATSNTKGLREEYFRKRLRQWQNVIPVITGWFLNVKDSRCLLSNLQTCLDYLLGDGKFCRIFDAYDKDKLLKKYEARKELYAIAACGERNMYHEIRSYCLSHLVASNYGQCFTITVQGFIVTQLYIAAIVRLDKSMQDLYYIPKSRVNSKMDSLVLDMGALNLQSVEENFKKHCSTAIPLDGRFESHQTVCKSEDYCEFQNISVNDWCVMIVAEKAGANTTFFPIDIVREVSDLLTTKKDSSGFIAVDLYRELDDKFLFCRMPKQTWLIKPPSSVSYCSIFTGIYT